MRRLRQRLKRYVGAAVGERGRSFLRSATFRPKVNRAAAHSLSYPDGRRAAVVISADLELAWAWRYARVDEPLALARQKARQGRRNLGVLLDLCDRYELPVTWATVGHLFLDHCTSPDGRAHPEVPRVPHFENEWWVYRSGDWFDADPACASPNESGWSDWYGPDVIRSILSRPVEHEIGCHTFSHAVLSDEHCPAEVAAAELRRCQELAHGRGLRLRSFVFPGNLTGNHASLRDAGFTIYRGQTGYELDVPQRDELGLWRIPGVFLERSRAAWTPAEQVRVLQTYVDAALEHGLLCSFWFHPETDPRDVDAIFPEIFAYLAARRSDLWVPTMGGLAAWLDSRASRPDASTVTGVYRS
jgi:hypothetical protein